VVGQKKSDLQLGRRERQIVELVYELGEASVSDVLKKLPDPPTYSTVRAMLGHLVKKRMLKFRQDGKRYLYRPAVPKEQASRSAIKNLLSTFFSGSPADAVAALLDVSSEQLTSEDISRMKKLIDEAKRGTK